MEMFFYITQLFLLLLSAFSDIRKKEISIWIVICMALLSLSDGAIALFNGKRTIDDLIVCIVPGVIMMLLALLSRQSIGYGDGLIILAIGMTFGISKLAVGIAIALFTSGIMSIFLIAIRKAKRNDTFPFVPFIFAGMVVSVLA
ncbi:leader peptidase (prepilin peptidase) / N-methyltransferase [Butyrivibrio sp. Su6]|uniref:prepilin peptidase n=1 Tax=Butyrivibrio sp. Su6 TaxID=1520810 RepID=UPI00089F4E24|nr:prepilin peptidase [Butyrivibrio sp. Su6]SEG35163.1 leader peptidase (prepilin peptidase) / N-methyltransferase [Butyrivibrio sp. Su6]